MSRSNANYLKSSSRKGAIFTRNAIGSFCTQIANAN